MADMREKLITSSIELIRQQGGASHLNLRAIARQAGCAHTNAYNYFPDFNTLLWEVMETVLKQIVARVSPVAADYRKIVEAPLHFALNEPGLARFLFLENCFKGPMPTTIKKLLAQMQEHTLEVCPPHYLSKDVLNALVQGYVMGELCQYLQKRNQDEAASSALQRITQNVTLLLGPSNQTAS